VTRFVVVPQWQGSPAPRAMLLVDGADAIAGDLPRASCVRVDVPLEAGEALDTGVLRLSALQRIRGIVAEQLGSEPDGTVVVGGDCAVALPAIARAVSRHPSLAVVWCDAHGDLHTPDTSPSGAFSGMALRAVLGDGEPSLALSGIDQDRVVMVGARDLDDAEEEYAQSAGIRRLFPEDLADPDALADAVSATGADAVYVHIDLDVLDPAVMNGVNMPAPFGAQVGELVAAIGRLRERMPLAGSSISGFAPPSPAAAIDDLGAILRLVGALA